MKKIYVFIAAVAFIFGFASGIVLAVIKISKKFEDELEIMFADREHDDDEIDELYALDGYEDDEDYSDYDDLDNEEE